MSTRIIAQISGTTVVNVVVQAEGSAFDATEGGLYTLEDVTSLVPYPSPGWTRTGTLQYQAPAAVPIPDPDGFGQAVIAASGVTLPVRLIVASWVPDLILALEAGNVPLIATTWSDLVSANSISSVDRSAVAALAATFNIPGIT